MTVLTPPPYAAHITDVRADSPAAKAGVKAGWELLTVNGEYIPDVLAYPPRTREGRRNAACKRPAVTR